MIPDKVIGFTPGRELNHAILQEVHASRRMGERGIVKLGVIVRVCGCREVLPNGFGANLHKLATCWARVILITRVRLQNAPTRVSPAASTPARDGIGAEFTNGNARVRLLEVAIHEQRATIASEIATWRENDHGNTHARLPGEHPLQSVIADETQPLGE